MNNKILYVECDCHDHGHMIIFDYIKDQYGKDVYLSVQPNRDIRFWKRLVYAVRYVLGIQYSGSNFEEVVLDDKAIADIVDFLVEIQNDNRKE